MKKFLSVFTAFLLTTCGCSISPTSSKATTTNTAENWNIADLVVFQEFLLGKRTDVNGKDYDLVKDGRWDVFDMILLRREVANNIPQSSSNILVAYFSCTNNTAGIAQYITDYLDADSYIIEPAVPYTADDLNYNTDCRANREQNDDTARPDIVGSIDISDYDTVFVGYPIWWGQAPKVMYTFMESADFSGKTIVPFCTSGSSGIGTSAKNLSESAPNAEWLDGKRFSGSAKESEVTEWVDSLDIVKKSINDGFSEIKGGTFTMGSPEDEPERSSDEIQHNVKVGSFYMSPTEVSQAEYAEIMGNNPSERKGDNLPVTNVTWYDAVNYCNALSRKAGLKEAYTVDGTTVTWDKSADGYRLPTEAEWEFAARAGTETPFSFGDYVHNDDANCYNAYGYNNDASGNWVNGADSYLKKTVEVTNYNANTFGLYNMHGNVAEWVWDWYSEYDTKSADNPTGQTSGNAKIIRGGGWNDHPKHIRSAYRGAHPANDSLYSIGIRPVRGALISNGTIKSTPNVSNDKKSEKVMIVYFSQTGNTDGLAQMIQEISGADIFRLERAVPYSSSSNGPVLYGEALDELRAEAVPELKENPDISGYDTILLGYCNWWSSIPASVRTFLMQNDMNGKKIIPFCSMGGGRFGQTISAVAKLAPNSYISSGLDITYSSYDKDRIEKWLKDNGII